MQDDEDTRPAVPIREMRRRHLSQSTDVNLSELLLVELEDAASKGLGEQKKVAAKHLERARLRGREESRTDIEHLRSQLREEQQYRQKIDGMRLELNMALLKYFRGEISIEDLRKQFDVNLKQEREKESAT